MQSSNNMCPGFCSFLLSGPECISITLCFFILFCRVYWGPSYRLFQRRIHFRTPHWDLSYSPLKQATKTTIYPSSTPSPSSILSALTSSIRLVLCYFSYLSLSAFNSRCLWTLVVHISFISSSSLMPWTTSLLLLVHARASVTFRQGHQARWI